MRVLYFVPAIIWLIASIILLTLPPSDFPHSSFFSLPYLDKYIHLAMFFLLTVLFSYPFSKLLAKTETIISTFNTVTACVILYGIIIEFVQKFFTSGRTFDLSDILFDALGSFLGLLVMRHLQIKIGPNENRGRNQN